MSDLIRPVRFSVLRAYGRSALHGRHAQMHDAGPTRPMELGSAVDELILGPRKVVGYPGSVRRGKEYDAFAAEHTGDVILTMADYDKARRMADAVQGCELAAPWLKGAVKPTILFRWNGLDCRATPDIHGTGFLTELKTSASADPVKFQWQALRMHYHGQMAMQKIACGDTGPFKAHDCYIVCVESSEPFPVTVFQLTERALEQGEKLLMLWAERLKNAEASDMYAPYVSCVVPIDIPDEEVELEFADDAA